MQLFSCLHPHRVWNKYSKEYVYAPCGSCPECLKHKAASWTQRLIQERYSWRYCVFATLTYDNDNVPTLQSASNGRVYYDLSHKHHHPDFGDVMIDVNNEVLTSTFETDEPALYRKNRDWLKQNDRVLYLSVGDAQRFIKRLRINLYRLVQEKIKSDKKQGIKTNLNDKDSQIRYYLVGEYGSTSLRPHYHALFFFSSEFAANAIGNLIDKSWQYGITDSSFVSGENAAYVSGYVTCTPDLPAILQHKRIRPFSLFSKHPFIGSLCHNSQEVRQMFFSASPRFTIFNHQTSAFDNVPLWLSYRRKIYPKLSGFSSLSHTDRVALYSVFERYVRHTEEPNFAQFVDYVQGKLGFVPTLFKDYTCRILQIPPEVGFKYDVKKYGKKNILPLLSWYYISSRVCTQSRSFGIPVRMYVSIIEKFYSNLEKEKLKNHYDLQEDLHERGRLDNALALDLEFVRTMLDKELQYVTDIDRNLLESFGLDSKLFFNEDDKIRQDYRYSVLPENMIEYKDISLDSEVWLHSHVKNKKKNDYLINHPELSNYVWDGSNY